MHLIITFNELSSLWDRNAIYNELFVKAQVEYIMDRYRMNGYIYSEDIYRLFGIKWNPYDENKCWIYERDGDLKISFTSRIEGLSIIIDITNDTT